MSLSLAEQVADLPDADRHAWVASLTEAEMLALLNSWEFVARPEQQAPVAEQLWRWWALITGRGWGKTRTGAEWVLDRCEAFAKAGARHLVGLVNKTHDEVRSLQIEGESGIAAAAARRGHLWRHAGSSLHAQLVITDPDTGKRHTSYFELHTSVKPDKARGRNFHTVWLDELAAWEHKIDAQGNTTFTNIDMGLRALCPAGLVPQGIVSTTPKPIPQVRDIVGDKLGGRTVVTYGSMFDNAANLDPSFQHAMMGRYHGTRLGAQELLGHVLDAVEGALWDPLNIDLHRHLPGRDGPLPALGRIVVGVDPSGSDGGDECGIIVVGIAAADDGGVYVNGAMIRPPMRHAYVLADYSVRRRPMVWGPAVVKAYRDWGANLVVAETNFGAALVEDTLHQLDPQMPVRRVTASRGKIARAEPASLVYDQGRVHHVGYYSDLETQMATWDPKVDDYSPDRMDALVWALAELLPESVALPQASHSPDDMLGSLPTGAAAFGRH